MAQIELTTSEAATWLEENRDISLKPDTLKRLCLKGTLPSRKRGGMHFIPLASLKTHKFNIKRGWPEGKKRKENGKIKLDK